MLSMSSFYCTSSPHQKPDEWKTTDPKKVEWPVMTRSGMVSGSGISIAQGLEELRRSEELSGLISGPFESMRHLTSKTSSFTSSNNQRLLVLRCFQAMVCHTSTPMPKVHLLIDVTCEAQGPHWHNNWFL